MNKRILIFIVMSVLVIISASSVYSSDVADVSMNAGEDIAIDEPAEQEIVQSEVKTSNDNIKTKKNLKQDVTEVSVNGYSQMITEINNAKTAPNPVVISLSPGNYNATAQITWGGSTNKNLTINGNGLTLDGNGKYKFALVQANNYLTLTNITLQNYKSSGPGGTIQCMGQINVDNSIFINNTASSLSGGVLNIQDFSGKHSTIDNCQFISNKAASGSAGAINVNMAIVTINNTKFINNTASGSTSYGGAIYNMGTVTIENSIFEGNYNSNIGGAIATDNKMTIKNTTFNNNSATRMAGAIHYGNNALNMTDTVFEDNHAATGGALYALRGKLNADNLTFTNNYANEAGAIYTEGTLNISNSLFENNNATSAAAIRSKGSEVNLDGNTFKENKADDETLVLDAQNPTMTNNIYEDTVIGFEEFSLVTDTDTAVVGDEISFECVVTLKNPSYYDEDILDKMSFQIFVNDENQLNSTGTSFTFTPEESGLYEIYAYEPISDNKTNTVSIQVNGEPILVVNPITASVGDKINITAQITQNGEVLSDVSQGKVSFKVNGKTLKDANAKVIYAKVLNGTATIEDYTVSEDWATDDCLIQAVYSGSNKLGKLISEKEEIDIVPAEATITTQDVEASASSTVTLTATITDGDKVINNGKVVFKINGKTIKNEDGKVIYAKVVNNQVSVQYTIPDTLKAGTYNLTAVFISPDYDRIEDTKVLTVI